MKLVIVFALVILLLYAIDQHKEEEQKRKAELFHYRRRIEAQQVVEKIQVAIELYNAYKEYEPLIKEYLQYFKDKRKLKRDICQWTRDKTLLRALAYILKRIETRVTGDKKKKVLSAASSVIIKLNLISIAFSQIPSFVKNLIPEPHRSRLDLFLNINEFTAQMLRKALGLNNNCDDYSDVEPVKTIEVDLGKDIPKESDISVNAGDTDFENLSY
jgi:hypothetical protein